MLRWEDLPKKSPSKLKEQLQKGLTCTLEGCSNPLTQKTGPGSDKLCRQHQKLQKEFNGPGRLDRPWTFFRKWTCDDCGKDVREEVRKKYPHLEEDDPIVFYRMCRNRMIADHIVRRADGGDDSEENIQSLCLDCNSDKTILSEDWRTNG